MSRITQAVWLVAGVFMAAGAALAQAQNAATTTITRDNPAARTLVEPAVKTQEDIEKAKPLDWNKTIGTPKRVELSPEQARALANAKPQSVEGTPPVMEDDEALRGQSADEPKPRNQ